MAQVSDILLSKKNQATYTIPPEATVLAALSLMANKGIGALVVTQDDRVVGIVSERDYARKVALMERSSNETKISEIMTANVFTVTPKHSISHCMQLMTEKHLRHLPVIDNEKLIGLISIGDVVKTAMDEQQKLITQLEQYISGY
jgi:CBS domain-containing protein